ncbi:MAG: ecdysteroid 22-kinase family protein [Ilumatobacteraceae bacterium]|nr:ecdysteroid 22-kinase family protein [Ilumatobacteraceae bacterium]
MPTAEQPPAIGSPTAEPIPTNGSPSIEQLNTALAAQLGTARVLAVSEEAIGTGQMSESRRLHLTYSAACDLPSTMIVKFPSGDPRSRATGKATRCYEVETSFYRDLRDALDVGAPRCFHVERNEATDEFLLLLEDFAPCEQGDQIAGCTAIQAEACVDELVRLHGPLWNSPFLATLPWLNRSTDKDRSGSQALMQQVFPGFMQRYGDRLSAAARRVGEEFIRDSGGYFRRELPHRTVVHGDFRLDNLLFRGANDGGVGVVDFQTATHACGAQDLAYFVGAGLTTEARRAHERELVQRWVEGLRGYNIKLGFDDAWLEYRRFTFAGYVMAVVASMIVKQTERGDDMFLAMANRHAQHAEDLDSLAAVRN